MIFLVGIRIFLSLALITLIIFTLFIVARVIGLLTQNRNNTGGTDQPVLTVEATVAGKRILADGSGITVASYTKYFITFEVRSGDRIELFVPQAEYGLSVEGDAGELTFQGRRFVKFERKRAQYM
jgi:hypothetical protein